MSEAAENLIAQALNNIAQTLDRNHKEMVELQTQQLALLKNIHSSMQAHTEVLVGMNAELEEVVKHQKSKRGNGHSDIASTYVQ